MCMKNIRTLLLLFFSACPPFTLMYTCSLSSPWRASRHLLENSNSTARNFGKMLWFACICQYCEISTFMLRYMAYLELSLLCEEVSEQHQHVGGHRGHIGSIAVRPVTVAKASAHRVVHKQHTGCLDLKEPTPASSSNTDQHANLSLSV